MPLNFDDFTKLFEGKGSSAGKFNPTLFVYSEMAVRHILLEFEKKLTQNLQPSAEADAKCICNRDTGVVIDPGIRVCGRCGRNRTA